MFKWLILIVIYSLILYGLFWTYRFCDANDFHFTNMIKQYSSKKGWNLPEKFHEVCIGLFCLSIITLVVVLTILITAIFLIYRVILDLDLSRSKQTSKSVILLHIITNLLQYSSLSVMTGSLALFSRSDQSCD